MIRRSFIITILMSFGILLHAQQDPFENEVFDTLNTAVVSAVKEKPKNTTQTGLIRLDASQLRMGTVSFGTPDLVKTLLTLPGVSAGNELMSGMYVHGGDGTDNLFLLDGVPLYNVSHFGGLFSSFNTDVTEGVDFYKSGFPARYGARLSSVVDVDTKEGDLNKFHGCVSLGLIDGRLQLEGPIVKGKTSFNIAYRRSWLDLMIKLAKAIKKRDDVDAAYFMHDLNAGITHYFKKDNKIRANFFWGLDDLDLGLRQSSSSMDLGVRWGNLSGSVVWDCKIKPSLRSNLLVYYTQSTSKTDYGINMSSNSLADNINSAIRDGGVKYNLDWFATDKQRVRAGVNLAAKRYRFIGQAEDPGDPESESPSLRCTGLEGGLFIEDEFFFTRWFTLNAGLRYGLYARHYSSWHTLEPRAALKFSPTRFMDIKVSYSRMSQGDHLVASSYIDLPSNTWMPSTQTIRPVTSDQVSGGLYFTPTKGMNLNVEGWYKTMNHLLMYSGPNSMFPPVQNWENSFTEGKGMSYGLEGELSWRNDKVSASAYYTLSWSRRLFTDMYPYWFFDHNDNRHKLNLIVSWKPLPCLELHADWNYHTGNRITFPSNVLEDGTMLYDEPYNLTLPDYHRLDFALTYTKTFKNSHQFILNASVYNLYNQKNAFFAYLTKNENGDFEGVAYSVIPIFPTVSFTYRF